MLPVSEADDSHFDPPSPWNHWLLSRSGGFRRTWGSTAASVAAGRSSTFRLGTTEAVFRGSFHGHHNRRGHWRELQPREAGYPTVSEDDKALGIGVKTLLHKVE